MSIEGLPDSRTNLVGLDDEGHETWLIRAIAQKLYRCPACHAEVGIGAEHVVVQTLRRAGGTRHAHWHRRCAEDRLIPSLRGLRRASALESTRDKLEARGRRPAGRRRRNLRR